MHRIVYPTITYVSMLRAYLHDSYHCEFQVWRFRGFIQVSSPLFSSSQWGNSERYLSYLYLEVYLLRCFFYIFLIQQVWSGTNVACVLKRVLLKSIAVYELVLCIISGHRPTSAPLTLDKHTGQTLVFPLGKSTKMGSECFLDPVVMIPLGCLLRIFLTCSSFASCLDTKT